MQVIGSRYKYRWSFARSPSPLTSCCAAPWEFGTPAISPLAWSQLWGWNYGLLISQIHNICISCKLRQWPSHFLHYSPRHTGGRVPLQSLIRSIEPGSEARTFVDYFYSSLLCQTSFLLPTYRCGTQRACNLSFICGCRFTFVFVYRDT